MARANSNQAAPRRRHQRRSGSNWDVPLIATLLFIMFYMINVILSENRASANAQRVDRTLTVDAEIPRHPKGK